MDRFEPRADALVQWWPAFVQRINERNADRQTAARREFDAILQGEAPKPDGELGEPVYVPREMPRPKVQLKLTTSQLMAWRGGQPITDGDWRLLQRSGNWIADQRSECWRLSAGDWRFEPLDEEHVIAICYMVGDTVHPLKLKWSELPEDLVRTVNLKLVWVVTPHKAATIG